MYLLVDEYYNIVWIKPMNSYVTVSHGDSLFFKESNFVLKRNNTGKQGVLMIVFKYLIETFDKENLCENGEPPEDSLSQQPQAILNPNWLSLSALWCQELNLSEVIYP